MTALAPRRPLLNAALAAALPALALAACSGSEQRASAPDDTRQLQVAPAKPAPAVPPPTLVAPVAPPKLPIPSNALASTRDEPLPPDAQVQEDAAAVGMTSRTTTASSTVTTTDRPSSMSNLY